MPIDPVKKSHFLSAEETKKIDKSLDEINDRTNGFIQAWAKDKLKEFTDDPKNGFIDMYMAMHKKRQEPALDYQGWFWKYQRSISGKNPTIKKESGEK